MITKLVSLNTVSRDSNLALIEYVRDYLAQQGVKSTLVPSSCGAKANLFASIGPSVAGGVVLSGHTDVVPIDGQDWHTDPFAIQESDGRLFGRGTCDMKSFIAIALALVPRMQVLRRPIHLALSFDEEIGCLGAPALIAAIKNNLPTPQAVIVGEPTMMKVVTAHKGILHFDTKITGFEAHSSLQHLGVSAVMVAGQLIHWLAQTQKQNAQRAQAGEFEPNYTTLHCGVVKGGTAHNITARECSFVTDIRTMPDEDPMDYFHALEKYAKLTLEPEMRSVNPDTGIEFEIQANVPGFEQDEDAEAVALVKQLTGQNQTVCQPYAAEAGQFQNAGFSVVMCGPGSIEQAHQPNEFISLQQVAQGTQFVTRLIEHLS